MTNDPSRHHRRSIRLKGYDYSQAGAYYITLVAQDRACLFGEIADGAIRLSLIGQIAYDYWHQIPAHFPDAIMDEFIVMPNHLHGIIVIKNTVGVEYIQPLPSHHTYQHVAPKSIGSIIRSYKAALTRWSRNNGHPHFQWQRDYYEHVVRNERDLERIRAYISNNPSNWSTDDENPG